MSRPNLLLAALAVAGLACTAPAMADKSDFPEFDDTKKGEFKKTDSGLMYRLIKPGSDKKPSKTDTVEVHYQGTLPSGKEFDSSYKNGETVSFPLNRVIPGWTEGLQLVGEGGQIQLKIPGDLAYGPAGAPRAGIGPNQELYFNVELVDIK